MMSNEDKEHWRKVYHARAEALAAVQAAELAAMTDEEALRQIKSLSVPEKPWRENPEYSGLVEQQALFHRKRKPQQ